MLNWVKRKSDGGTIVVFKLNIEYMEIIINCQNIIKYSSKLKLIFAGTSIKIKICTTVSLFLSVKQSLCTM